VSCFGCMQVLMTAKLRDRKWSRFRLGSWIISPTARSTVPNCKNDSISSNRNAGMTVKLRFDKDFLLSLWLWHRRARSGHHPFLRNRNDATTLLESLPVSTGLNCNAAIQYTSTGNILGMSYMNYGVRACRSDKVAYKEQKLLSISL